MREKSENRLPQGLNWKMYKREGVVKTGAESIYGFYLCFILV